MDQANSAAKIGLAGRAFRGLMGAGLLVTLAANLPGHLSLDSVVALTEARTDVRQTWAPAIMSGLMKPFDAVVAGTGLYVAASATLLFVSLMSLVRLRGRASWLAVVLGGLAIATPQILIYQGIVWRDVIFANLTIAGFICLAHAARRWRTKPAWALLAGAEVCLALAALERQNGLILSLAAAAAVAWTVRGRGWGKSLGWGLGVLAVAALLAAAFDHLAQPSSTPSKLRLRSATLILQHYDIIGAKAHHPALRMTAIGKADPGAEARLERDAARYYSAARVDTLDWDDSFRQTLWHIPDSAMNAQWRDVILHEPAAYVLQRGDVFRWVLATPKLDQCLPIVVGVSGPDAMLRDLNLVTGEDNQDRALGAYAQRFFGTPVFSHLTWLTVALAVAGVLLLRRDPADWIVIALLAGTITWVFSFAVIAVACDYRYLYLLDLAAMVGVLYAALDPPWRRRAG